MVTVPPDLTVTELGEKPLLPYVTVTALVAGELGDGEVEVVDVELEDEEDP